ncbi:MAG: GNAT family N-acetyltransferase [Chloroflexota bacterium]|nr:GNAT family N-acetyltransferase [Chloroflexota bacterium]
MGQTRITIRPLRLDDGSNIYELMHMPNVLWGTSLLPSTSVDAWCKTVEGWVYDERMHVFVAEVQGKVAGIISVHVGVGRESHVGDIAMAVHDKFQGQGIGKMLLLTVIDLADNWLNLVRLELDVYTDNEPAIHVYKHFDFEIEGRKRLDAFRGGRYIDSYIMARLHHERYPAEEQRAGTAEETASPNVSGDYVEMLTRVSEAPAPPSVGRQEEQKTQ